jgi:hypothetical protein
MPVRAKLPLEEEARGPILASEIWSNPPNASNNLIRTEPNRVLQIISL